MMECALLWPQVRIDARQSDAGGTIDTYIDHMQANWLHAGRAGGNLNGKRSGKTCRNGSDWPECQ
jgi:hypothetical protein